MPNLTSVTRDYLEYLYQTHPSAASFDGVHRYDDHLEDFSAEALARHRAALVNFQQQLVSVAADSHDPEAAIEREMIEHNLAARLHDLDEVRAWTKNPQFYVDAIASGLAGQALFDHAPAGERLRNVVAKERQIPRLLDSARRNITDPPAVFVKVGLETARGTLSFVERDLPEAFRDVADPGLRNAFDDSTRASAAALRAYVAELSRLARAASGTYVLGADAFAKKLRLEEGVLVPLPRLLAIAERELAAAQERFREAAARVDARRPARDVWNEIKNRHPSPGRVVAEVHQQIETLRAFLASHELVTMPEGNRIEVRPTPEFYRWTFASMWTPGPFEARPLPAYYYITDVDPAWSPAEQAAHLRDFNYPTLWAISIHEVYPGHFLHYQVLRGVPSTARRTIMLAPASFIEGWAHYCEQMMFEEGFGAKDQTLRLGELAEELVRLVRFAAAIRLHTGDCTLEQATRSFVEQAYMEEMSAVREAERGAFDPTYLVYTLGKLGILKLREDYRRAAGTRFSLRAFHDRLLRNGNAPIWAHRRLLMPEDRGPVVE